MNKALRYAGFALAGLVVLVIALLVLARFLITSDQVRKAVLPKAQEALQRDVALGEIDISIFSGIVLHDLRVMDKQGEVPFVAADAVELRYRFWPLLRLKVVVDEVRLEQPQVRIVRNADGTFNFSDLLEQRTTEAPATAEEEAETADQGRALDLLVSEVLVSDGRVRFVDYQQNPDQPFTLDLSQLNLRAKNISASRSFPLEAGVLINQAKLMVKGQVDPAARGGQLNIRLTDFNLPDFAPYYQKPDGAAVRSLQIDCDLDVEGTAQQFRSTGRIDLKDLQLASATAGKAPVSGPPVTLEYELAFDGPAGVADLKRGRLLVGDLPIDAQGQLMLLEDRREIDAQVTIDELDLASLSKTLPAALLGNLPAMQPAGLVRARLQLAGPLSRPKTLLKSGTVSLEDVAITAGALRPRLSGDLSLSGDAVRGRKLNLVLGEDRALLDLTAENLTDKPIRITTGLTAERLQLDALLGQKSAAGKDGSGGPKADGVAVRKELGPYDLPLAAQGTLQVGQALWRGLVIQDLNARYQLKDNILTLEEFGGKTAGGTFSETARVDLTRPGLAYRTHIETRTLQIDPLLSAFVPKASGTTFGLLNLEVDMQGRGTGLEALQNSLSGNGSLTIADGRITGAGLVEGLADFFDLEELRVLRFSRAAGQLVVKDGRVQLDGNLAGEQVRLAPTGSVGLDGSLDVGLPVRLAPALTARLDTAGKFSRFLTDAEGWGSLPLKLTGTVTAPRFALDTAALGGDIRRGVQEQLQKTLQEKLFKPKQDAVEPQGEEGAADTTDQQKKADEEELLKGVIKGLFD